MKTKHMMSAVVAVSICVVASVAQAGPIVIDGNLADWGVTVGDNDASVYDFRTDIGLLGSYVEDQSDTAGDGGFLGPNYGGQNYDAEMIAVAFQDSRLYISILTGQRPDNGFARYSPGDIRIETSGGVYGIEVGGGSGGGDGAPILTGEPGSTYRLKGNGFTKKLASTAVAQTAGSAWRTTSENWILDPIAPHGPVQLEIDDDSTAVGVAEYIFTRDTAMQEHAMIELALDIGALNGEVIDSVQWRPSCGNDEVVVSVNAVPEPATLTLLAVSALGIGLRRRK